MVAKVKYPNNSSHLKTYKILIGCTLWSAKEKEECLEGKTANT